MDSCSLLVLPPKRVFSHKGVGNYLYSSKDPCKPPNGPYKLPQHAFISSLLLLSYLYNLDKQVKNNFENGHRMSQKVPALKFTWLPARLPLLSAKLRENPQQARASVSGGDTGDHFDTQTRTKPRGVDGGLSGGHRDRVA